MLTKIKSVLAGITPALPAASPSQGPSSPASTPDVVKAQVHLKKTQLRRGTTKAQVERLTTDVAASQRAVEQARHILGELWVEGLDTAAATEALRQAEGQLREDQEALVVAQQKDDEAQRALTDAHRQATIEVEAAACARVLALGPRFEEVSALVRQLAVDTARETEALRVAGGTEKYAFAVNEIRKQFDLFLRLSGHSFTNNAHVPQAFMKYNTWTACLEAICGMRASA